MKQSKASKKAEAIYLENKAHQKAVFIRRLAQFLAGRVAEKSLALDDRPGFLLARSFAQEWAELRGATPIFGNPTIEEAEKILVEFLK